MTLQDWANVVTVFAFLLAVGETLWRVFKINPQLESLKQTIGNGGTGYQGKEINVTHNYGIQIEELNKKLNDIEIRMRHFAHGEALRNS